MKKLFVTAFLGLIFSIAALAKKSNDYPPLKTPSKVDISKYMGSWYVIANIPTALEKGAYNAVETYTWHPEDQTISVDFHYNKNAPNGEIKRYPQTAYIYNKTTNAEWRTKFFGLLKFPYIIMQLAPDYSYVLVGMPDRSHVWIMARDKKMSEETYNMLVKVCLNEGFDVAKIQKVPQNL